MKKIPAAKYYAPSQDIIKLAQDHTRMIAEVDHLMLVVAQLDKGGDYTWILDKSSKYSSISYIA
jgi:hypothetical protein